MGADLRKRGILSRCLGLSGAGEVRVRVLWLCRSPQAWAHRPPKDLRNLPFSEAGRKHRRLSHTFRIELSPASTTKGTPLDMYTIPSHMPVKGRLTPVIRPVTDPHVEAVVRVEGSHSSHSFTYAFSPWRLLPRFLPRLLKSQLRGLLLCLRGRLDFLSHLILDT